MKRFALVLAATLMALVAFAQPESIREGACPADIAADVCGYLSVPEHHAAPQREQLELFVAIKRATNPEPEPEPIIYLEGGPGVPGTLSVEALAEVFPERDLVGFDQRGIGRSRPQLTCPALESLLAEANSTSDAALSRAFAEILKRCGQRLKQEVDLSVFHAAESAGDVEALRLALGAEQVNLVGGSYGTRLAQEVMRRYPAGLRAVVLDSVIPTSIDRVSATPKAVASSLSRVFEACAAAETCAARYPNLPQVYARAYESLNSNPLPIAIPGFGGQLTGDGFQALVLGSLYLTPGVAELPSLIAAATERRVAPITGSLGARFGQVVSNTLSWGAFYTHECRGEVAFSAVASLREAYRETPQWRNTLGLVPGISSESIFEVCEAWGLTEPAALENAPVTSEVPTLLLAGEFDPVTPPVWLPLAAEQLHVAYPIIVAGTSHVAGLSTACGIGLIQAFLSNPTQSPDATCAKEGQISFK